MENKFERLPIPPLHGYWDPQETKKFGDKNSDAVYISVGRALSTWETAETTLSTLFGLFVESNSEAAKRAYGAISSPTGRNEALQMAATIFAGKKGSNFPQKDFELLMKHHKEASRRRNEIAHGIVTGFNLNGVDHGYFLMPSSYNSRANYPKTTQWWESLTTSEDQFKVFGAKYRYTSEDINNFGYLFRQFDAQVSTFLVEQMMNYNQKKFNDAPNEQKLSVKLGPEIDGLPPSDNQNS